MIVVTDTSVVLCLCHLGLERLLPDIFGEVLSPPAVLAEFRRLAQLNPNFHALTFPSFIRVCCPQQIPGSLASSRRLHAGEREALALALEQKATTVLMDERAGRTAAASLGLTCIGVLGILIRAKSCGLISAVSPLLSRLETDASFWIVPALRERILATVNELPA